MQPQKIMCLPDSRDLCSFVIQTKIFNFLQDRSKDSNCLICIYSYSGVTQDSFCWAPKLHSKFQKVKLSEKVLTPHNIEKFLVRQWCSTKLVVEHHLDYCFQVYFHYFICKRWRRIVFLLYMQVYNHSTTSHSARVYTILSYARSKPIVSNPTFLQCET